MANNSVSKTEIHIGNRVLAARLLRGFSHETLASELGVTCNEVQDYERGENLSGRLCQLARVLQVDASFFYDGLNGAEPVGSSPFDERLSLVKRTLQHIAADHVLTPNGFRKRLSRDEAIRVAREACEALGWEYGKARVSMNGAKAKPAGM